MAFADGVDKNAHHTIEIDEVVDITLQIDRGLWSKIVVWRCWFVAGWLALLVCLHCCLVGVVGWLATKSEQK